jgi:hypothetical protein
MPKIFQKLKMFCEIIYMHILMHIYVSYFILNNIFTHLSRIFRSITRGYQLVTPCTRSTTLSIHILFCNKHYLGVFGNTPLLIFFQIMRSHVFHWERRELITRARARPSNKKGDYIGSNCDQTTNLARHHKSILLKIESARADGARDKPRKA